MSQHPIQPLELDRRGVLRFKANAIVRHLLDNGGISMNDLACMEFSQDDCAQFAQLIGYSHGGSGDLGYVSDEIWEAALATYQIGKSEHEARADVLRCQLAEARAGMRPGVAALFNLHPDDLEPAP